MSDEKKVRRLRRWNEQLGCMRGEERSRRLRSELEDLWYRRGPVFEDLDELPLVLQLLAMMLEREATHREFMGFLRRHDRALHPTETQPGHPWVAYVLLRYDPAFQYDMLRAALRDQEASRDHDHANTST
jgi:hypothetical protein